MKLAWFDKKSDAIDCFSIRKKVFVLEQGFSEELEFDDIDGLAYHLCVYDEELRPIAAARLFVSPNSPSGDNGFHCGRICVLKEYRGGGMGKIIMAAMEQKARELVPMLSLVAQIDDELVLSAQLTAMGFYEKCGFIAEGESYLDEHCPHIKMSKSLAQTESIS